EQVYTDDNSHFRDGYMYGTQDSNFMGQLLSGGSCLLKIHGDFQNGSSQVFTKKQYADAYGAVDIEFEKPLPQVLRQVYISNTLFFFGFSLETDKTLDVFSAVNRKEYQIPWHYAFLEMPESGEVEEREDFLSSLQIIPIWYPHGEHEHVDNFMEFLIAHKNDDGYWPEN
ncbi:MAG: SIR2 family protein, partial [Lentisphaeraceae bacterium]|nr:SIR2 family protein [Lentisphaeraceae bacterium]